MHQRWAVLLVSLCLLQAACSPRDFLTRRLAADLIAGSSNFREEQQFWLRTGLLSNRDYESPEYMVLQHRGWIAGASVRCPKEISPPPCWDVALTPLGVDTFRDQVPSGSAGSQYFSVRTVRRELIAVTGISKNDHLADVDFSWRWVPLNLVGAALYPTGVQYRSVVSFKHYDDGWRLVDGGTPAPNQGLEDALKNAEAISNP